jgi:phage gp45-like
MVTVNAPIPVITITTHPAANTTVTQGSITGNLSVAATVSQSATLSYQWYNNTTNSNTGGTVVSGATSASFTIPTTLTAGTYY